MQRFMIKQAQVGRPGIHYDARASVVCPFEPLPVLIAAVKQARVLVRQIPEGSRERYVFEPVKDSAIRAKHGGSLVLAAALFAGPHGSMTDDRFEYGEVAKCRSYFTMICFSCVFVPTGKRTDG